MKVKVLVARSSAYKETRFEFETKLDAGMEELGFIRMQDKYVPGDRLLAKLRRKIVVHLIGFSSSGDTVHLKISSGADMSREKHSVRIQNLIGFLEFMYDTVKSNFKE